VYTISEFKKSLPIRLVSVEGIDFGKEELHISSMGTGLRMFKLTVSVKTYYDFCTRPVKSKVILEV
jgi:hypothetical protein